MKLDKKEIKTILIFGAVLFVWFNFLLDGFYKMSASNPFLYYFIFIVAYSGFIAYFVFGVNPIKQFKLVIAYFLAFILGDLLIFPILVPMHSAPVLTTETMYSSDIFLYSFIKNLNISDILKYNLVYVVGGIVILVILGFILGGRRFTDVLKSAF